MKLEFTKEQLDHVIAILDSTINNAVTAGDGELGKDLYKLRKKLDGDRVYYSLKNHEAYVLLEFARTMRGSFGQLITDIPNSEMNAEEKADTLEKATFYLDKTKEIIDYLEVKVKNVPNTEESTKTNPPTEQN